MSGISLGGFHGSCDGKRQASPDERRASGGSAAWGGVGAALGFSLGGPVGAVVGFIVVAYLVSPGKAL
jgi:hypothetical protein